MTVDKNFLSPRDIVHDGQVCLNGPRIMNGTKFAIACLNLPQSVSGIRERAHIDDKTYNHYADILLKLLKVFVRMFEIADDFRNTVNVLNTACSNTQDFAKLAESTFPELFDCFSKYRKSPTTEMHDKINKINMECIVSANIATRNAGLIGIGGLVRDWQSEQQDLQNVYRELIERMKAAEFMQIIEKLFGISGGISGLENLKTWVEELDTEAGSAINDLKAFEGSWHAIDSDSIALQELLQDPHSKDTDRLLQVELAHLLEGWKTVKSKVEELQQEFIQKALDMLNSAPHR
ncbi:uncharacterized protein GIQ15_02152 [Arthroderma uncinatum]|uniref:uncharacterized protein n=1 Tax=Arthroderma uncinatum TaxID=74035 RepID=UPI00144AE391|nr:uncharacterized protein GIQ15_02152 [Arthroderma uncinatum]KAF3482828.1 hypothetical protein GIQ15_02152 [Arthroderma uncinatum]